MNKKILIIFSTIILSFNINSMKKNKTNIPRIINVPQIKSPKKSTTAFVCSYCNKAFLQKNNVTGHIKDMHPKKSNSSKNNSESKYKTLKLEQK